MLCNAPPKAYHKSMPEKRSAFPELDRLTADASERATRINLQARLAVKVFIDNGKSISKTELDGIVDTVNRQFAEATAEIESSDQDER